MKSFIPLAFLLLCSSCSWFNPEYTSGLEGQPLPVLSLQRTDSSTFNTSAIPAGKPMMLFLYQPSCHYCQQEIQYLVQHINYLKDTRIYMVTSFAYPMIQSFAKQFNLSQCPNIILLRDSTRQLLDYYKAPGVPYIAIYNSQRKLSKVYVGRQDNETLKRAMINL